MSAVKAVAMISGGLDSVLAVKTLLDLGIDVLAVNLTMPFGFRESPSSAERMCQQIGAKLHVESRGDAFLEMVSSPKHGYGKHMNPCIDCRIMLLKRGKQIMQETGAKFLATGEVVGQRPMSQRKDTMNLIDRVADVQGMVVRPLCAKNMPETIAEQNGWIDREKLLDFSGRTRTPQIALANKFGILDFETPAGGCELTESHFSLKLKHLFEIKENVQADDWSLLKVGRHFHLGDKSKVVISRNEKENSRLDDLVAAGDCIMEPENFPGPTSMIVGPYTQEDIQWVGAAIMRYSKNIQELPARILVKAQGESTVISVEVPAPPDEVAAKLIY